ncbi:hypothetical protein BurMR1_3043 [Burkholderia sp. MR1]|nr:hypothetical protein BurMR1_3043 [Burkholderia sp. MR1]
MKEQKLTKKQRQTQKEAARYRAAILENGLPDWLIEHPLSDIVEYMAVTMPDPDIVQLNPTPAQAHVFETMQEVFATLYGLHQEYFPKIDVRQ